MRFLRAMIQLALASGAALTLMSAEGREAVAERARGSEGKAFGRGECWDFVAAMLDEAGCDWKRPLGFGRPLNLKREPLLPGDILMMESVRIEWKRENRFGTIRLGFPQHFGVVLSANGPVVEFAHQNYNRVRQVTRLSVDLREVKAGKVSAFRPIQKGG